MHTATRLGIFFVHRLSLISDGDVRLESGESCSPRVIIFLYCLHNIFLYHMPVTVTISIRSNVLLLIKSIKNYL